MSFEDLDRRINDLPSWQKRGIAAYREDFDTEGRDPRNDAPVTTTRRRLRMRPGSVRGDFLVRGLRTSTIVAVFPWPVTASVSANRSAGNFTVTRSTTRSAIR